LSFLQPRLMHSCATVVIPLHDGVVFIGALNRAEFGSWFPEVAQALDAITGSQFGVGHRWPTQRGPPGTVRVRNCTGVR
jgi:hypothetical protein